MLNFEETSASPDEVLVSSTLVLNNFKRVSFSWKKKLEIFLKKVYC